MSELKSLVSVSEHPLISHKLSYLRDRRTPSKLFRELVKEIAGFLVYEATRTLPTRVHTVQTPTNVTVATKRVRARIALVPILRSGQGLVDAFLEHLTDAQVFHLGMYRDPFSKLDVEYYNHLPPQCTVDTCYVLDVLLATGGTAIATVNLLKIWGCQDIRVICLVASKNGIAAMQKQHPGVPIHAAAIDPTLDEQGRISPGIGDSGDRLFNSWNTAAEFHSAHAFQDGYEPHHDSATVPTILAADAQGKLRPFFIAVTGGTASGKTTVCHEIVEKLQSRKVSIIPLDAFYFGLNHSNKTNNVTVDSTSSASNYNFDEPASIDFELLEETLHRIITDGVADIPVYDFKLHQRTGETRRIEKPDIVILEGILLLYHDRIRRMMDLNIFVDVDPDTRLSRRILRDCSQRGRNIETVLEQYDKFVKPAYDKYIAPSKMDADLVIPFGKDNMVAIDLIVEHVRVKLQEFQLLRNGVSKDSRKPENK